MTAVVAFEEPAVIPAAQRVRQGVVLIVGGFLLELLVGSGSSTSSGRRC